MRTIISFTPLAIPGPIAALTTWLPGGYSGSGLSLNLHLAWSAFAGLGVALTFRPGKWQWLALAPLLFASLDHATFNATLRGVYFPLGISGFFVWARKFNAFYPVAALLVAFAFDHVRLRRALDGFPPLPLKLALDVRYLVKLWRLILVRRELALGLSDDEQDWDEAVSRLEEMSEALTSAEPAAAPTRSRISFGKISVSVILAGPPLIFFATAGFPHLAWIQEFFASPPIFAFLRALSVAGLIMEGAAVLAVIVLIRKMRFPDGRFLLVQGLTLFSALGGLIQGMTALAASAGRSPLSSIQAHILEHWIQSNPLTAIMLGIAIAGLVAAGLWLIAPEVIALLGAAAEETEGIGTFVRVAESMSEKAAAYQARVTGTERGWAYVVNGVKFDGFADDMLIEAKSSYAQFVKNGGFRDWFRGAEAMARQARNQLRAAGSTPIQWRFAEESAAEAAKSLFLEKGITGIDVVYMP